MEVFTSATSRIIAIKIIILIKIIRVSVFVVHIAYLRFQSLRFQKSLFPGCSKVDDGYFFIRFHMNTEQFKRDLRSCSRDLLQRAEQSQIF